MTNDPSSVSGTCPPSRLGQLEEENARLKAELGRVEGKAYRNAAVFVSIQIGQAEREGSAIPARLKLCVPRLQAMAKDEAESAGREDGLDG